jgi:hypothetical protein
VLIILSKVLPIYFFSVNYIAHLFFIFVANAFICLCLLIVSSEVFTFSVHCAFTFLDLLCHPWICIRFPLWTFYVARNE